MSKIPLEIRLEGTPRTRFLLELFGNSAQFPITNFLLELLREGPAKYLSSSDPYIIIAAGLIQAYWLSRWQTTSHPRRFWGNLIGPGVYTAIEIVLGGVHFFTTPNHLAYWGFALAIGALQTLRARTSSRTIGLALIVENVIRASILLVMYAIFETLSSPDQTASLGAFFADTSHQFVALTVLLLGFSAGMSALTAQRYLDLLRETSTRLRTYSEWLLGRELLERSLTNPSALTLTHRERSVLFIDIRGFTRWSEAHSPEAVADMLNRYYQTAESIFGRNQAIKFKFSADEALGVFPTVEYAVRAVLELREQINAQLSGESLGVGIGLHAGPVVEGLLGSMGVQFYDVIGDTVNTAKRIESAADAGEALISENVRCALDRTVRAGAKREIVVKGKNTPLAVYPLE